MYPLNASRSERFANGSVNGFVKISAIALTKVMLNTKGRGLEWRRRETVIGLSHRNRPERDRCKAPDEGRCKRPAAGCCHLNVAIFLDFVFNLKIV